MAVKKHKMEEDEITAEVKDSQEQPMTSTEPEKATEVPVVIPEEEIAQLRSQLDEALAKANEYLCGWQRERAEFFNYKKRMEREQALGGQNAFATAIRRYLDIADDLERALKSKNRPTDGNGVVWADGIDLILRKMIASFETDGVKLIDTHGKFFDPNMHEAISHEDSPDHESGEIIEVVQPGYTLGERVIRPARVRVAR